MEVGMVHQVDIDQEMRAAYLDYAMSVIVSRALPDARDGLKPVHRRILYAMYDMGLRPESPYRKSARIVGEVLGKYHPHGDAAVYEAMVRMAQDFSMRYPLVDGQGNFGSIDGDAAAAMRYTEARIDRVGLDLLSDIGKNTVEFTDNFDGSLREPSVLPSSVPNLIVNGSSGIAVGMSTSIPPHNMGEVCDALIYLLANWERLDSVGLGELMQFIKGPDFPTGGMVFRYEEGSPTRLMAQVVEQPDGRSHIRLPELPGTVDREVLEKQLLAAAQEMPGGEILGIARHDENGEPGLAIELHPGANPDQVLATLYDRVPAMHTRLTDSLAHAYATGRGKVVVQAKAHIEALDRNRNRIIITELPYQVNKTSLIERIAELARDARLEGLTDLRDESDRQGMRIVIDLTRTVDPYDVLSLLYKLTPMRQTFSIIMLALVDNEPRLLSLKQALRVYLEHRFVIVHRRSEHDLARARERAHILEGYLIALDHLDEVIRLIRQSATAEAAHGALQERYALSDEQAQAILDMPLRRLAALERQRIEEEHREKLELIDYLQRLLADPRLMRDVISDELVEVKRVYADPRRTLIVNTAPGDAMTAAELVPDEQAWVVLTESGLLSRTFDDQPPRVTQEIKDPPRAMLLAGASEILYLFTRDGHAATIPMHQIPQAQGFGGGPHFASLAPLGSEQQIAALLARAPAQQEGFLTLATVKGMVKRVALEDVPGLSAKPFRVIGLVDDELGWAMWTGGDDELVMISAEGKGIRFREEEVRPMGLPAAGVNGIKLGSSEDRVVGAMIVRPGMSVWTVTANGFAKSSPIEEYPVQGRYGQGVIAMKLPDREAKLAASLLGTSDDTLVVITSRRKPKAMRLGFAPETGRNTVGSSVIALGPGEIVVRALLISRSSPARAQDEPESPEAAPPAMLF